MYTYFYDFINSFMGIANNTISTIIAQLITVCVSLGVLYLLTKLVFPTDTAVKKAVFITLFIVSMLCVLYSNGITLMTITQITSSLGVSAV